MLTLDYGFMGGAVRAYRGNSNSLHCSCNLWKSGCSTQRHASAAGVQFERADLKLANTGGPHLHAGVTSENVASRYGITRQQQDEMAARSHKRAAAARASGRFKDEIVPVKTVLKDKEVCSPSISSSQIM